MLEDLPANTVARPYRALSVQDVGISFDPESVRDWLLGREAHRRTEYVLLRNGRDNCLVRIAQLSRRALFNRIAAVDLLASGDQIVALDAPGVDVSNPNALAALAFANLREGALAYVVRGAYAHINFIWKPRAYELEVWDVVPPFPPRLVDMVNKVLAFDDELPPTAVIPRFIDLRRVAAEHPGRPLLLPCHGVVADDGRDRRTYYLGTRLPVPADAVLLGCEGAVDVFRHIYDNDVVNVDTCPHRLALAAPSRTGTGLMTKCCKLEGGIEADATCATVPWGCTLDEVRAALRSIVGLANNPVIDVAGQVRVVPFQPSEAESV